MATVLVQAPEVLVRAVLAAKGVVAEEECGLFL
jgi:hypothetical protein